MENILSIMFKKIKYITAGFLLLILPVSVIGLNLNAFRCNMLHTTTVSFLFNRQNDGKGNLSDIDCNNDNQSCSINNCKNNVPGVPNFTSPACCVNTFESFFLEDNSIVINILKIIPDFTQFFILNNNDIKFDLIKIINTNTQNSKINVEKKFDITKEFFSHLHNKLVHFPISLAVLAFIFTIISRKKKEYEPAILVILIVAAIFTVPTIFTGLIQADSFTNNAKEWLVDLHEKLGYGSALSLFTWLIFLLLEPLKKYAWIVGLLCVILILITGFYGGIVAH